jgi:hypothetical protein
LSPRLIVSIKRRLEYDKSTVATFTIRVLDHYGVPENYVTDISSELRMIFYPIHPGIGSEVQLVAAVDELM